METFIFHRGTVDHHHGRGTIAEARAWLKHLNAGRTVKLYAMRKSVAPKDDRRSRNLAVELAKLSADAKS